MARSIFALPVSVEQVAAVIKQMSPSDRRRLLSLVPELRQAAVEARPRTMEEARGAVNRLREEVKEALGGQLLSPTEPFLEGMTLEQYLDLPDEERSRLWEEWSEVELEEIEELDVSPSALPAR